MRHFVLTALFGTNFANLRTGNTKNGCMFTADSHKTRRGITHLGALEIELDTPSHHFHIIFAQASCCAILTLPGARKADVNTRLHFFFIHTRARSKKLYPKAELGRAAIEATTVNRL